MNPKALMLVGLGMAALGGLLTLASQADAAENGGTSYIFTGLLVVGGLNFVRGIYYYSKSSGASRMYRSAPAMRANPLTQASASGRPPVSAPLVASPEVPRGTAPVEQKAPASSSGSLPEKGSSTAPQPAAPQVQPGKARMSANTTVDRAFSYGPYTPPADTSQSVSPFVTPLASPTTTHVPPAAPQETTALPPQTPVTLPPPAMPIPTAAAPPAALPTAPSPVDVSPGTDTSKTAASSNGTEKPRIRKRRPMVVIAIVVLVAGAGVGGAYIMRSVSNPSETRQASEPTTAHHVPAPDGFTATRGDDGWATYTSKAKGFSISLPQGWRPELDGGPGPKALFDAFDRDPSYDVTKGLGTPRLLVLRVKQVDYLSTRKFFQVFRTTYETQPTTIGGVELYRDRLPAGGTHIFRLVAQLRFERRSYTAFWVANDGFWYELVFGVPVSEGSSYLPVFNNIAQTLQFA
jgi:hypothetical protein